MVMMLPFVTGAVAVWFALSGRRRACLMFWAITLALFAAWCAYHMTEPLNLSF